MCVTFAPTFGWLWHRWTLGIWYSGHAILMPIIVAYLVHQQLREDPAREPDSSAWGFLFLIPSLFLLALDSTIQTQLLSAFALVTCLPGLSLLLLGANRTKRLIFPLIIAYFMLPIPAGFVAPVHLLLRQGSAWGAAEILPFLGIPVHLQGTMLHTPKSALLVADACSGFSTLYAAVTTALILAHWSQSRCKWLALLVSAFVLSLICNMIRVTILVLLIHTYGTGLLDTPIHEISGFATFVIVLVFLFAIAGRSTFQRSHP
jgi:exosortase